MRLETGLTVMRLGPRLVLVSVPERAKPLPDFEGVTLSSAERAVVELALRGLSNREIAARRGCALRTIANQLASAYGKIGIGSRRELRARADGKE